MQDESRLQLFGPFTPIQFQQSNEALQNRPQHPTPQSLNYGGQRISCLSTLWWEMLQDVVVRVKLASICGSDMHPYAGRGVQLDDGIIFGHEFVGEVVDAGSEVQLC